MPPGEKDACDFLGWVLLDLDNPIPDVPRELTDMLGMWKPTSENPDVGHPVLWGLKF
jgi:hypothetical protein